METYEDKRKVGEQYQEFVKKVLFAVDGIVITYYKTKEEQYHGESNEGYEVKHDRNVCRTNNLYIETAEKTNPNNPNYVKSGILKNDNSIYYVIGDYNTIYIFLKQTLLEIYRNERILINRRDVKTPTSMGFLLQGDDKEKYAIEVIHDASEYIKPHQKRKIA